MERLVSASRPRRQAGRNNRCTTGGGGGWPTASTPSSTDATPKRRHITANGTWKRANTRDKPLRRPQAPSSWRSCSTAWASRHASSPMATTSSPTATTCGWSRSIANAPTSCSLNEGSDARHVAMNTSRLEREHVMAKDYDNFGCKRHRHATSGTLLLGDPRREPRIALTPLSCKCAVSIQRTAKLTVNGQSKTSRSARRSERRCLIGAHVVPRRIQ